MGRKKLDRDQGRTRFVQVRVTPPFKEWLDRYADSRGRTLSELIVDLLIKSAKRDRFEPPPTQGESITFRC